MNRPYRVEISDRGCGECQTGMTWWVVGPDEIASSTSYDEEEDANSLAAALNAAYELGQQRTPANPWVKFSAETTPRSTQLLTWDYEYSTAGSMYTSGPDGVEADLQHARIMKYSHWMLATAMRGPPQEELPVIEPPPPAPAVIAAPLETPVSWEDDIPF